jgi:hypothetical protein
MSDLNFEENPTRMKTFMGSILPFPDERVRTSAFVDSRSTASTTLKPPHGQQRGFIQGSVANRDKQRSP